MENNLLVSKNRQVERQCAVSKETKPVREMIRFVVGPAGEVVPDLKRVLPGRGVWITTSKSCVEKAVKKNVFVRRFDTDISVNPNLSNQIELLLEKHTLDYLRMVRKAGEVVMGFSKTNSIVRSGEAKAVIHAFDASDDGLRKLKGAIMACYGSVDGIPIISSFGSERLSEVLGKDNVVNAALLKGRASSTFIDRVLTLEQYRKSASKLATS